MKVDLDELTLEHKFSNHLKMTKTLMGYLIDPKINKSDVLTYDQIINKIDQEIESCYGSAFHAPLIISMRFNDKLGHYIRFRLLKTKWLKDKLSFTYEFITTD
jgi:hypothetical protein